MRYSFCFLNNLVREYIQLLFLNIGSPVVQFQVVCNCLHQLVDFLHMCAVSQKVSVAYPEQKNTQEKQRWWEGPGFY